MDSQQQPARYKEKSVIIHRDENGFGLRVGGQNPVIVDHVHENGAAWKAGVRKDDRIIKVNGTLVRSLDHQRVVHMIQNCTPFVNLTLHSSEPIVTDQSSVLSPSGASQSNEPNTSGLLLGSNGSSSMTINNTNNITNNNSSANDNGNPAQNTMKVHQRLHHPQSVPGNLAWLLDIGDDLFQDNQQKQPTQQQANVENISVSPNAHQSSIGGGGVSKLIVSGPSPTITSHSQMNTSSGKPKMRHNRNQSASRDNPYYYYKTAPERVPELASCNSAINSLPLSGQDQAGSVGGGTGGSSKSGPSLSIVRSRSSSKLSLTSTSGKYKPRNLRSRFVDDLRSLTITNSQATPSSLSTSPSSSDLSDCDDQDSNRIDCLSLNTTNCSASFASANSVTTNSNTPGSTVLSSSSGGSNCGIQKSKQTTRRFEIIRELVETEKAHTERLKHLNDLLYKPIKAEGLVPMEQLKMVFSCHKTLFKIHRQIYKILFTAQQNISECHQEPLIGRALVEIFEGELGKRLEKAASTFCACQSTNTELLNRFTKKDTKVGEFLAQVANQQMLGRLGIKDLLASCFQRLTKYPLLLENLLKATQGATCGIHSKSLSEGYIITGLTASSSSIVNNVITTTGGSADNYDTITSKELPISMDKSTNNNLTIGGDVISNHESNQTSTLSTQNNATLASAATLTSVNPTVSVDTNTVIASSNSKTTSTTATNSVNPTIITATTTIEEDYAFERLCISRALNQSRQILIHVNDAVKREISHTKLRDIWRKTDKSTVLPVINIETEQMLHEGPLTLRLARRSFEVYVLLLTHYLVILTREGQEKYKLKCFNSDGKTTFSPIFNIDEHLATRDSATDENGFYLLCKRKEDSRIYEFASQSPSERAGWKEKIHMAQTHNFATVPDDDNMLSRYRELITLATSSNTPNNIEHSPTSNSINTSNLSQQATIAPPVSASAVSVASTIQHQQASDIITCVSPPPSTSTATTTSIGTTVTTTGAQQINSSSLSHDLTNTRAQDV